MGFQPEKTCEKCKAFYICGKKRGARFCKKFSPLIPPPPPPSKATSSVQRKNVDSKTEVLYLCDRKKCDDCSYPNCKYTTDITHAENFKRSEFNLNCYIEKNRKLIITKKEKKKCK